MYGTMPNRATAVISAARPGLLPKREAMRSASEALFCARATRASRPRNGSASSHSRMIPTKVGGIHTPQRSAWVTVP